MKYIKKYEFGIRDEYSKMGVDNFYKTQNYTNPHLDTIQLCLDWVTTKINITSFIDLAAGNGEITTHLNKKGIYNGVGIDPYLCDKYKSKTGEECINLSFEDISKNGLDITKQTIICSYALHLCDKSYFNNLMYNLSTNCEYFILISPSKHPVINDNYFELIHKTKIGKTHCKIFNKKGN